MTLYTIMPMDVIWEGSFKETEATVEVIVESILMQVMPMDQGNAQIVRLLNCSLNDYLNPLYAPGQMIRYIPSL
ncbi:YlzJ-like family protein [Paenibacillus antarcticus]|uniref:Uncharacterized protein n=1 Tax=Paenibacillus antarcticus TaxID=253703 RepID=A0A168MU34_9BACL|nr:YlzJ-like family protein [Paenibacillus antarcticus]OAB45054.1 hypothetical protein PBAT_14030 [Paenibacillus antarcticus]